MTEYYYTELPKSEHDINQIYFEFADKKFTFRTDSGVFSKREIDKGTAILLKTLPNLSGKVVDMGCGYGVISIVIKSLFPSTDVYGIDINQRAIDLSKHNAYINNVSVSFMRSDGLENTGLNDFDNAIINPPIRAGKANVYRLYSDLHKALKDEGAMYIVIRTKQGAKSSIDFLKKLFYKVETLEIKSGYRIIRCGGKRNDLQ